MNTAVDSELVKNFIDTISTLSNDVRSDAREMLNKIVLDFKKQLQEIEHKQDIVQREQVNLKRKLDDTQYEQDNLKIRVTNVEQEVQSNSRLCTYMNIYFTNILLS
jgi:BMFP domain-containing protein YqiC